MNTSKKLVFITGNSAKAKYLSDYFHITVDHKKIDLHEIQSLNLREVVEVKAREAYTIERHPVGIQFLFRKVKKRPGQR